MDEHQDDGIDELEDRIGRLEGLVGELENRLDELEWAARPPVPRPRRRLDPSPQGEPDAAG